MLRLPRWLWLNHVPEGLDLTPEQKVALRARMRAMGPDAQGRLGVARRMMWHMVGGIGAASVAFFVYVVWLVRAHLPPGSFILANTGGVIGFNILIWIAIAYGINRGMRPLVWRALNDIGLGVCMGCGYVLDYLPASETRCPECGAATSPPSDATPE